jgi:hypothetical protein
MEHGRIRVVFMCLLVGNGVMGVIFIEPRF